MANNKITKSALFSSVLALILCFTMLLGTTFAWFTDSAASARNVIKSGHLDVVLEYKNNWDDDWCPVTENTKLFKNGVLYEPGYTEVVFLRVSNVGNLSFKYNLNVKIYDETTSTNVNGDTFSLKDYLEIGFYVQDEMSNGINDADIRMPTMFGTREAALGSVKTTKLSSYNGIIRKDSPIRAGEDSAQIAAIVLTMPTTVGNEANHKTGVNAPTIDLGVTLLATQLVDEYDSFGNDYDKGAAYPIPAEIVKVEGNNKAALLTAIDSANPGDIIKLSENTTISGYGAGEKLTIDKPIVLDLNGKTITTESGWGGIDAKGGCSIINGTINHTGNTAAIKAFQVERIENVTINVTETAGKTKGGIVVQNGANDYVGVIKNVTINGATNGIECYNSANSNAAIGSMENVTINATSNGIYLNGAGRIGLITNCNIYGGNIGINAYLANLWHIALDIRNSNVSGGASGIDIWDEAATNTGSTVTFNYDTATVFTGSANNIKVTLGEEISCTINGTAQSTPCDLRR